MSYLCIYHANCADGFAAAWVVHRALGDQVEFHAATYGDTPPEVINKHVLVVDFSYPLEDLTRMQSRANSVMVLDHHKTAEADLRDIEAGSASFHNHDHVGLRAIFNQTTSGAGLVWDWFNPGDPRPLIIDYVEDRDLWKFQKDHSREINSFISTIEDDFGVWDTEAESLEDDLGFEMARGIGHTLEKWKREYVDDAVSASKRIMRIGGHDVPCANVPFRMASDAGNLMCKGNPFAATYCDTEKGRVFSLRSTDAGLDVSVVAKSYGGGGHRNASGFKMPIGWEGDL